LIIGDFEQVVARRNSATIWKRLSQNQLVNIEAIKKNASEQGIPLSEIAVIYDGLTDEEKNLMRAQQLITHENGAVAIARFSGSGEVLFPSKVKGVHYLGA
jgi:hypothetical protein